MTPHRDPTDPHPNRRQIRGITVTENQYLLLKSAQDRHDANSRVAYIKVEQECKASQDELDELWRKVCVEGFGK